MSAIVTIHINGAVDLNAAEGLVSRIRAAMRGGDGDIRLEFGENVMISSAEFLAFLSTANRFLKEQGRTLSLTGVCSKNRELLRISRLESLICTDTVSGGV